MPEYLVTGGIRGAVLLKKTPHNLIERKSLVGFALDRSSSMAPLATVAIQSVNQLLEEQRKIAAGDSRFTLTLFNNDVQLIGYSRLNKGSVCNHWLRTCGYVWLRTGGKLEVNLIS